MSVNIKGQVLNADGILEDRTVEIPINPKETIENLKKAWIKLDGYTSTEEIRIVYRTEAGTDIGLEDHEVIKDIQKIPGNFVAEFQSLGIKCETYIFLDNTDLNVEVLIGSTKDFEWYFMSRERNKMISGYKWCDNKIAIVEKEGDFDGFHGYLAMQYLVRHDWKVKVFENPKFGIQNEPKFILKKILENGEFEALPGNWKKYPEKNSKHQKLAKN